MKRRREEEDNNFDDILMCSHDTRRNVLLRKLKYTIMRKLSKKGVDQLYLMKVDAFL